MICPSCSREQNVTENNYGALYTCTLCQAVYFINFEGQPEYGEAQDFPVPEVEVPASVGSELTVTHQAEHAASAATETFDNPFSMPVTAEETAQMPFEPESMSMQQQIDSVVQGYEDQTVPARPIANAKKSALSGAFSDIAQEISSFANTDTQLAHINYDLTISGIDTVDTKKLFQEAIEDSKFAWDAIEIMKSIRNGEVTLTKLTPAKAYLLAKRIQFLDIEKSWKQNALG